MPIPGRGFAFATLERAQASRNPRALREGDRRAGRVDLDDLRKVTA